MTKYIIKPKRHWHFPASRINSTYQETAIIDLPAVQIIKHSKKNRHLPKQRLLNNPHTNKQISLIDIVLPAPKQDRAKHDY